MAVARVEVVAAIQNKQAMAFGPPCEWCDRRCGRCVLEPRCEAAREERERRRRHEERGEDPNAIETVMRDLTETLGQAIEISREALREMGRDPDAPIERPPPSVLSRSIHVAAMDLGRAARELGDEHWWIEGPVFAVVMRMAGKAARLCAFLAEGREPALDEVVAGNAFATLLLLEALDEQVVALQALGPAAGEILEARARFWRVLDPLRAQVPIASRAHLARLVERRRAPSPFVVSRPPFDEGRRSAEAD